MSKPGHYDKVVDPWDLCISYGIAIDFARGNIIKYVARYKENKGLEDLYKAKDYMNKLVALEERKYQKQHKTKLCCYEYKYGLAFQNTYPNN